MRELLRTNDLVRLSWVQAYLADAGIEAVTFDNHASVLEGSVVAITRRLMVIDEDYEQACTLLAEADAAPNYEDPAGQEDNSSRE
ncbi:putative signal transducing protein [Fodinicurvata fenggangensis]|uniref:putative signal transducing protein n=1 Tax=Fodinicurvata fenggangensis TaxID=1121830 RepID=UPI00068B71D4|nr:DUF2007 domain-containing protein [Fodinicurvata fenggangensis]